MKIYKVKYKPYGEFIGRVKGLKQCTADKRLAFKLKTKPTDEDLRIIVCGMVDRQRILIYDLLPHRIKDLSDLEVVEFEIKEKRHEGED